MWINLPRPSCLLVYYKRMRNVKIKIKNKKSIKKLPIAWMWIVYEMKMTIKLTAHIKSTSISYISHICGICIAAFSILLTCRKEIRLLLFEETTISIKLLENEKIAMHLEVWISLAIQFKYYVCKCDEHKWSTVKANKINCVSI